MRASMSAKRLLGGATGGAASASGARRRLPVGDGGVERGLALSAGRQRRTLAGVQGAQRKFGGEEIVFRVEAHDPRQSLSCSRLRRSQVFTVGTGLSNRRAKSSRLWP